MFPGGIMKKTISLLLIALMLFGTLVSLTGCGAPKNDGAEINIYLGDEIFDFDPSDYYVNSNVEQVLSLMYEPLFYVNDNGKLKLAAAEEYEVDKEKREIVITLRESYWSDNLKVKAADFVYAWCDRILSTDNPNPASALFLNIEGVKELLDGTGNSNDVGIKVTEMDEITITYCEGADYKKILTNLASVATAPVRQDIVEVAETYWSKSANSIVTNGPFRIKNYDRVEGTFELARNVGYHQAVNVKDYDDNVRPGLLYGNFSVEGKEIAVSYDDIKNKVTFIMTEAPISMREEYKKKADTAEHTSTYTYVFNTSHPLFADANVRLALSAVIDREAIIKAITFGKAADGFIPDVCGGSKDKLISTEADLSKAQEYLSKANQEVVNANKSFTLTIDSDEESKKIAEIVETAWESLGFSVTVEAAEPVESEAGGMTVVDSGIQYLIKDASYGKVNFDVIAIDWQMYSTDPIVGLASLTSKYDGMGKEQISGDIESGTPDSTKARDGITGWTDSEYDKRVEAAMTATSKKDRKVKLTEAEQYLLEAMPVCPLVFNESFVFTSSKISKIEFDGFGKLVLTDAKLRGYTKYYKPEEEED